MGKYEFPDMSDDILVFPNGEWFFRFEYDPNELCTGESPEVLRYLTDEWEKHLEANPPDNSWVVYDEDGYPVNLDEATKDG